MHLHKTIQEIMGQRSYPPMVKHLLGEAIVACLLLANSIKFEGSLNLQFQGDERLSLLLVQCDHELNIRAFAKCQEGLEIIDYANAFLHGQFFNHTTKQSNAVLSKRCPYKIYFYERKFNGILRAIRTNCHQCLVSCYG